MLSCLATAEQAKLDELPDQLFLSQHWISYTTSFDIESKSHKLGTLYRRVLAVPLTYDLYNYHDQFVASARARFFSIGAHFDVYDADDMRLGSVEEKIFTFFPSFDLISSTGEKAARAEMNFWGTTFTVYEMFSNRVIATMSRSFFRVKNDWTITFKEKELLREKNISPELFLTVLAFQADVEYWRNHKADDDNDYAYTRARPMALAAGATSNQGKQPVAVSQVKRAAATGHQQLDAVALLSQQDLEQLANQLQQDYQAQATDSTEDRSDEDKVRDFVSYCLTRVSSDKTPAAEKKAILYLLEQRLNIQEPK